jgi:hypothetical protein
MPFPLSHPDPIEAGKEWLREAVHSLARVGKQETEKRNRGKKSMHYPFNDPEAVMICSRERERERKGNKK